MLEGFQLFMKYDYIKGIFAMSCLFMVEVTILDYTMKVIAPFPIRWVCIHHSSSRSTHC